MITLTARNIANQQAAKFGTKAEALGERTWRDMRHADGTLVVDEQAWKQVRAYYAVQELFLQVVADLEAKRFRLAEPTAYEVEVWARY